MTNTTAQYTPAVGVNLLDPSVVALNGVPTNGIDVVGTASFGPTNQPTTFGSYAEGTTVFGNMQAAKYDGMTVVAAAGLNGGTAFNFVRITDGTDTAATTDATVSNAVAATLSAKYTGSLGNQITVNLVTGGRANTLTATVSAPGMTSELYPNLSTSAFWTNLANAVNLGSGVLRGPSLLLSITNANASVAAPAAPASYTLSGGTNGANTINASVLVGAQTVPAKGMYATAQTTGQILVLADCDDSTVWTTVAAFAEQNYKTTILTGPAGDTVSAAITRKSSAGLNSNRTVLLHGDWVSFDDTVNGLVRKISPQGFYAGMRANLLPSASTLNKVLNGIVTTERLASGSPYSTAETDQLFANGIDLITNPIPRGAAFGVRGGYTTTSIESENFDSWSTLSNYLAATLQSGTGLYVGGYINNDTYQNVTATLTYFLDGLVNAGILFLNSDGSLPFTVVCNASNNPQSQTALGYLVADVAVTYPGIVRFFNINMVGGTIVVTMTTQAA